MILTGQNFFWGGSLLICKKLQTMDLGFYRDLLFLFIWKFSAGLIGDDIFRWEVIIIGPPETAYEGFVSIL